MANIPEGTETIEVEGKDLASALATAAEKLEVSAREVAHKIDLSHFRSNTGTSVARTTVKIIAWVNPNPPAEDDKPKRAPKKARKPAKSDDAPVEAASDDNSQEESAPAKEEVALEQTEASAFAAEWFTGLLGFMDLEGEVAASGNDERVRIAISNLNKAGRLIGKRGTTLGAVRHLLGLGLKAKFGDLVVDVDVEDGRDSGDRRSRDRSDRGDRGDRGDRRDRRGKDRRDRRGRDRDRDRDRGSDKGRFPPEKLQALAERAAAKALESGKTFTINLELNSYDRRLVHMAVADIEGVQTRSKEQDDGTKLIQVFPLDSDDILEAEA